MKPSRFLLTIATLALAFLFTFAAQTATAKPKPAAAPSEDDTRILVKSVDATAGTVEIEYMTNKTSHVYKIDAGTTIKVNDAPAKISDIQAGMQVRDSTERDSQSLDTISVSQADLAPAAPATPKKKKKAAATQ